MMSVLAPYLQEHEQLEMGESQQEQVTLQLEYLLVHELLVIDVNLDLGANAIMQEFEPFRVHVLSEISGIQ